MPVSPVTSISSNLSGWITAFPSDRGRFVNKGDILLQIDDRAGQLKLEELELEITIKKAKIYRAQLEQEMVLAEFQNHYMAQEAKIAGSRANRENARSALLLAQNEFKRANTLLAKKLISKSQWERLERSNQQANQNYQQSQAELEEENFALQQILANGKAADILTLQVNILKQELKSLDITRAQQQLDLYDRQIRSPIEGIIDRTFTHNGEFISPGRRILMLHNPQDIWIDANIIETEIRHIRTGMLASVKVDAYPDQTFRATVESIDHATTSEYALLPNPNPSGNFTKVTQRLRVRFAIAQKDNLLKPGMMVEVNIDTRH